MIIDKNGKAIELDSMIEVHGKDYKVIDIDGNFVITTQQGNGMKRRFSISDLSMTNTDASDEKRKRYIDARTKLRDYWEN